ncbi:hypothetical protein [Sorangium sp. So ce131]|uniref:hypothetical protein n=1 Tax=Sorangium sp. So ce131 TaxID=3133282 RepID=UPI003F60A811
MSFSARSFAFLAVLALAPMAACGDDPEGGSAMTGGGSDGSGASTTGGPSTTGGASTTGGPSTTTGSTSTTGGLSTSTSTTGGGQGGGATTGTGTGGTSTGSGGCAAANIFCSDFEGDALPSELQFFPAYLRDRASSFVTLDSTGHSGTRSIKVSGTDFSQMLGIAVPSTFWGRVYMKSDTAIQSGHNTYVAATTGDGDPNGGEHIRIGEHQCQLELNRKTDDAEKLSNGGTYQCEGGVRLEANTWYCLEFYYNGPGSEVRVFVDDAEVDALHVTNWGPYDYKLFKLGFEKYHGGAKNLWYDDLALGAERIGCDP